MMKLSEYRQQLEESKEYTDAQENLKIKFALAEAVYEARINKGWTQKDLAKVIGTKQANISKVESGLANPTLDFISRLISVLDFDINFSCGNEGVVGFVREPNRESLRDSYSIGTGGLSIEGKIFAPSANQSQIRKKEEYA